MRASLLVRLLVALLALAVLAVPVRLSARAVLRPVHGPARPPVGAPTPVPTPVVDPVPAAAPAPASPTAAAAGFPVTQPCFGAASVDPAKPCENPALALTVFPAPQDAQAAQTSEHCDSRQRAAGGLLDVCFFGAPAAAATRTVALLGDSHAAHWRAALDAVLAAHRWRAISIQRAGCPLTLAHPNLPGAARQAGCMDWNRAVQAWMAAHPGIDVVFTSQHRGTVVPPPGQAAGTARRAGYIAAWKSLLSAHVRQIVVIRDTPRIAATTLRCVQAALTERRPPGPTCALSTRFALRSDPAADAARQLASPQVQVADLATFFCRRRRCPPVSGGALVLRDVSHMTTTYSTSLGPYLLQRVDALMRSWPATRRAGAAPASAGGPPAG